MMTAPVPVGLRRVWERIPDPHCKGLCVASCGPIGASPLEHRLLAERGVSLDGLGITLERVAAGDVRSCPALSAEGRCTVYEVRPTVCRLWGAVEDMACRWGCVPDGGLLSAARGREILWESLTVGASRAKRRGDKSRKRRRR